MEVLSFKYCVPSIVEDEILHHTHLRTPCTWQQAVDTFDAEKA